MMRICVFFLALLVSTPALAQDNTLDSLHTALKEFPREDSIKVDLLVKICQHEFFAGNKPKVLLLSEEILALSKKINYTKGVGIAYNCLALYYQSIGDFDNVAENCLKMIAVFEASGNTAGLARAYSMLALVHQQWKDFAKAEVYLTQALKINEAQGHLPGIAVNYMNLGVTLAMRGKYDQAITYFSKALAIRQKQGDDREIANALTNLGNAYVQKKDFRSARRYFEDAYPFAVKSNNPLSLFEINTGLIKIDTTSGDYQKASIHALKVLSLAQQLHDKTRIYDAYQLLSEIEKHQHDYEKAFTYQAHAHAYSDSIFTETKALQITELETKYETEKKEQIIQLLSRDQKISVLWTNILISGLVIVIALAMAIYLLQRYRQRKNLAFLNVQVDLLTAQHRQLAEKYKQVITGPEQHAVESIDQRLLRTALEVVERNLADPLFGVEKMAQEMAMSRANLHRRIKEITGFTPSDFIRSIRLKRAANQLRNRADSVAQVGFSVGYEYQSYFSKAFKKQFGVSPSEYATQHINPE